MPANGKKVRAIAEALVALRTLNGIPTGDFAATCAEVSAAASATKARRLSK